MGTLHFHRPWMYPKQLAAIYAKERFSIIEASVKSGKTVGCVIWLLEQAAHGDPGQQFWWVAPIRTQAKIAMRRLKRYLDPELYETNEAELTFTLLATDTTICFKSAEVADSLFGEDVYAVVIDEATRCRQESWIAIRSTLTATRGRCRIIGNVKGRKNWAYQLARRAESGEKDMHYAKITAWDAVEAGILDKEEIDDAKRAFAGTPQAFQELYLAEPSDDEGNPFGLDKIRACIAPMPPDSVPNVWGWDLAKSVDWTVGIGLDAFGRTCSFSRFQQPWDETIGRIVAETNGVSALVDSTGVGDPILERLQKLARDGPDPECFQGLKFTSLSKQQIIEGLAAVIQQGSITFPAGPIVAELESFEYTYTRGGVRYSAPEGLKDDCVVALALAQSKRDHAFGPLSFFSGTDEKKTKEEIYESAKQEVIDAIQQDGVYWPVTSHRG